MANSTRDIVGLVRHSNGKVWAGGIVTTRLVTAWAGDDTQPADEQEWKIATTGAITITLAVPDTGTVEYQFELPEEGGTFTANIGLEDGSDIDFESLVEGGGLAPDDVDTTLAMINARLNPALQILTDAATVVWDFDGYPYRNARVTLGGNRTLSITNLPATPASGFLEVFQDATGSRTLTLPTDKDNYVIEDGQGAITLSSAANARDILSFVWDGTALYWTYGTNFTKAP